MRPAIGGGHGVAIPAGRTVGIERPGQRPFDPALPDAVDARKILRPREGLRGDAFAGADLFREMIGKPAGELEHGFCRHLFAGERRGAFPADFDAREEVGLGARQLEQALGVEAALAENLGIGDKADGGTAPVGGRPEVLDRPLRDPAREFLRIELLVARDLDAGVGRQRVDHADADAMQTAAGGIGLARKLAARMQGGEDHLQRRLARELGVLVNRDAAAIIGDRKAVAFIKPHLDPRCMARDRLVHRVVEHFGGEVVKGALVRAADIHARAAADRLEPFENLDGAGVVIAARSGGVGEEVVGGGIGHPSGYRAAALRLKPPPGVLRTHLPKPAGAGSTATTSPPLTSRTSSARSTTPVRAKRKAPSTPRKPPLS